MKVEPLVPDIAPRPSANSAPADAFTRALDGVGALLSGASAAEDRYAGGTGSLQAAMVERARADVALAVATATAQRSAQALTAILNMQI
jgi:flagellar hook-basal body complex protein FliE